jgi:DNA repair exonuclease SbcCD ATPase subunit
MEKTLTKEKVFALEEIKVTQLPELQGWKEKQLAIVEENPFVSIQDFKSYEEAKKHRTALVSARTSIQKQDKLIALKLKEIRSEAAKIADELISITQPHEEKQQEEVKRYEAEKEAERLEKERQEEERKKEIQRGINLFYSSWKTEISSTEFSELSTIAKSLEEAIEGQSKKEMEEFEMDFAEKVNLLKTQLTERAQYLTEKEEARKETKRLAAERAAFAKEQAEAKAKAEKEEAERKAREEKERAAREAEAEKLRKEREELEAEKKRITDAEAERQAAIEAEAKAKKETEEKAKAEAEAKAKKEAEEKRLEALQPDKEKLIGYVKSVWFGESIDIKDNFAKEVQEDLEHSLREWKASAFDRISKLK